MTLQYISGRDTCKREQHEERSSKRLNVSSCTFLVCSPHQRPSCILEGHLHAMHLAMLVGGIKDNPLLDTANLSSVKSEAVRPDVTLVEAGDELCAIVSLPIEKAAKFADKKSNI